jgi:glycosyltransferase involved in cell wall biosynthesis
LSGIKKDQIRIVVNGVDTNVFKPDFSEAPKAELRAALKLPQEGFLIGCVGALRPVKDHEGLLKAFTVLRSRTGTRVNRDSYLVLVGDGTLMPELKAISKQLGIQDRVLFMGRRDDVEKILGVTDVFVLNSKTEGMSYAILEAMSSGIPIVATDVGANRELIRQGVEGYLYKPGDLEGLVNYLLTLIDDKSLVAKMGGAARKKIVENYSFESMVSAYERLYREVAERG